MKKSASIILTTLAIKGGDSQINLDTPEQIEEELPFDPSAKCTERLA